MADLNSLVDTIVGVADQMIGDLYSTLNTLDHGSTWHLSTLAKMETLDKRTLSRRIASQGLPFLTVQLPRLGKELDRYLSVLGTSEETSSFLSVEGFKTSNDEGHVPLFLGPIWIYTCREARELILADPTDADRVGRSAQFARWLAIVRTFCYLFYKLEVDFTDEQRAEKLRSFCEIESGLEEIYAPYPTNMLAQWWVCDIAETVLAEVLDGEKFPFIQKTSRLDTDLVP